MNASSVLAEITLQISCCLSPIYDSE
jgi:hypothetical protein